MPLQTPVQIVSACISGLQGKDIGVGQVEAGGFNITLRLFLVSCLGVQHDQLVMILIFVRLKQLGVQI